MDHTQQPNDYEALLNQASNQIEQLQNQISQLKAEILKQKSSIDALQSENQELTELVEMLNGSDKELRQAEFQKKENSQESKRLASLESELATKESQLNNSQNQLADAKKQLADERKRFDEINANQEKEVETRLKIFTVKRDKQLQNKYNEKNIKLQNDYNKLTLKLWSTIYVLMIAAIIPIIGLIVSVESNRADFIRFISAFINGFLGLTNLFNNIWIGLILAIVITGAIGTGIFFLGKWFKNKTDEDFSRKFFCIAIAVFELLIMFNYILPEEYNPFWIASVLTILGMILSGVLKD